MRNKLIVFVFMILVCQTFLLAATGDLDLSFGDNGIFISAPSGANDYATSVAMQSDGKIVVGGYNDVGTNGWFKLIRLNQDGTLDNSFGNNGNVGTIISGNFQDYCEDICIQPDGKIVAVGRTSNGPSYNVVVVRYNSDGSLDTSFDSDGIVITDNSNGHDYARSVVVQPDGKILVAGDRHNGSFNYFALIRYNSDGSLDTGFGNSNGVELAYIRPTNHYGESIVLQDDGKIVLCGTYINDQVSDRYELAVLRFNVDGTVDQEFGNAGLVTKAISSNTTWGYSAKVQSDGKIVIGGTYQSVSNGTDQYIIRLNTDGSFDNTFGLLGVATITSESTEEGRSIYIQEDGKLLIGGYSNGLSNLDLCLTRLNNDGSIDSSFNQDGMVTTDINNGNDFAYDITIQDDGKIILIGDGEIIDSNRKILIVRYFGSDLSVVYNVVQDGSGDFTGIQAAIDYANNGDTIFVHPGTYVENINFNGKNIVVGSLFLTTQDTSYISSTIIDGNQAGRVVIFNSNESPSTCLIGLTITNGSISGGGVAGGGIFISNANPTLKYVTVTNCWATADGGGIQLTHSNSLLDNVIILNNSTDDYGGGINCHYSSPIIMNSIIRNNSTYGKGGGMHIGNNSDPVLQNLLIVNNSALKGGGIDVYASSSPQIINCTISGNISTYGGGIYLDTNASPFIINSIFWDNAPQEIEMNNTTSSNTITVAYSDIKGGETAIVEAGNGVINWEVGNIDVYPSFIDTISNNFTLSNFSPCIGMGLDTIIVPSTDINGSLRPNPTDSNPDMGAYENSLGIRTNMLFSVKTDGTGDYTIIQSAIDASLDDDTVLVYPGTYIENINFNGKNIVVGSLFLTTTDTSYISTTIIDGNQNGSVVTFESGEDSTAVLGGFTIQNGSNQFGGGIKCINSNPTLKNLIISGNYASDSGGGLYSSNSDIRIYDSIINSNESNVHAAGIKTLNNSKINIIRASIVNNNSTYGHTIDIDRSIATIILSEISNNNAGGSSAPGINCFACSLQVINSNILYNTTSTNMGGGLIISGGGSPPEGFVELENSLIWGNGPDQIWFSQNGYGSLKVSYCDVEDGQNGIIVGQNETLIWGNGNIDQYPSFIDSAQSDYSLNIGSPCIDTGNPDLNDDGSTWETDSDDQDPDGTRMDMGAYYYHQTGTYSGPVWHVDVDAIGFGDGSQEEPLNTIQAAIDYSTNGDTVLVYPGIYVENINFNSKNIVVMSKGGPENTIIDGNQAGSVVTFENGENSLAQLIGLTITNGLGSGTGWSNFYGGGITCRNASEPILTNLNITVNSAQVGGGIYIYNSNPIITNSKLLYNTTSDRGGGCYLYNSSPTLNNVLIIGNTADNEGGGIFCFSNSNPRIINSTIFENTASANQGGAIFCEANSNPIVFNTILFNNSPQEICFSGGNTANSITLTYTNIQGDETGILTNNNGTIYWLSGNINLFPQFVDPSNNDYNLSNISPCIGVGADSVEIDGTWYYAQTTDIIGNPRPDPYGSNPDMGAYENPLATPLHNSFINVDTTGNDNGSVGLETAPFASIQAAIDYSQNSDTVLVHPGTYIENINFNGKNIVVGSLFLTTQDTSYISSTIIDGNQNGSVVTFELGEDSTAKLIGFTVIGGNGTLWYGDFHGGGIFCLSSNPTLTSLIITLNTASDNGGGMYCNYQSDITLSNVKISNNSSEGHGGGIYFANSNPNLDDVILLNNSSLMSGGGIFCYQSNPNFNNLTVSGNSAYADGGGIALYNNLPDIYGSSLTNIVLKNNSADYGGAIHCHNANTIMDNILVSNNIGYIGGGIYIETNSKPIITNSIIFNNIATYETSDRGGGIVCRQNSNPILINSIIWNNTPQQIEFYDNFDPNSIVIAYSDIEGGIESVHANSNGTVNWLIGNIDQYPDFIDTTNNDFHLSDISPCIGAGADSVQIDGTWYYALTTDIDGNPRPNPPGSNPDMGAYENPLATYTIPPAANLFFSEFIEGSAWNKAIEIYNNTDSSVSLIDFSILSTINGSGWISEYSFQPDIFIESNEILVIADPQADPIILIAADLIIPFVDSLGAPFNGDDAAALVRIFNTDTTWLDIFGNPSVDPGLGWDVAGVVEGTFNHTLIRKSTVESGNPNYESSFGTNFEDSEWFVLPQNYYGNIGEHGNFSVYSGAVWHVDTSGLDDYPNGTVESPVRTIQYAIDRSINGDTVLVNPGTYVENINFNGHNIVVGSLFLTTQDTSYISSTIIDGNQNGSVVVFSGNENNTCELIGFTITNGYGTGAGIYIANATPRIRFVTISNNHSSGWGGGIYVNSGAIIENTIIRNNTSEYDGGAIYCSGSDAIFYNILVENNTSGISSLHGAISSWAYMTFINCTIVNNLGGGLWGSGNNRIINSIIRHNSPINVYSDEAIIYSNIEGGWPGQSNIDNELVFENGINYLLSDYSSCIGAGIDSVEIDGTWYYAPKTDIDGNPRPNPAGSSPDIGAYENALAQPIHNSFIHVATTGNDTGSVGLDTAPFASIQTAIDYSQNADTVLVHSGTYVENINFNGKNIVVGSLFLITQDTSFISSTIIDGNQNGSVVTFESGENSASKLIGFSVTNGNEDSVTFGGGGIKIVECSPSLLNNTIFGNSAYYGGGLYIINGSPILTNLLIRNNSASAGGGIFLQFGSPTLTSLLIHNNNAAGSDGFYCVESYPEIQDVIIRDNGTGVWIENSSLSNIRIVNDNIFSQATTQLENVEVRNGEIFCNSSNSIFANVTIHRNGGSCLVLYLESQVTLINSVLSSLTHNPVRFDSDDNILNFLYSNIYEGLSTINAEGNTVDWGLGSIDADPLFNFSNNNYYLSNYSPCLGTGIDSIQVDGIWYLAFTTDIEGNPRPNPAGSNPDMGAYENPLPSQLPLAQSIRDGLGDDLNWTNSATLLSSNWDPFIDDSTITYECAIGTSPDTISNILDWTPTGTDTFAILSGFSLSSGTTYYVSVRGTDIHDQPSDTATTDGIIVDLIDPMIGELWDGDDTGDIDWQSSTSEFAVYWTGSDSRVIANYQVALSSTPGDSDIVDWTDNGTETSVLLSGLNLTQGNTYYANVRAMDEAKNWSGIMSSDGVTIDGVAPITGQIFDDLNGTSVYSANTDSLITYWSGFYDEHSGIDHYELALGTNPGNTNIVSWDSTGTDTVYNIIGLSLDDGLTYYASIKAIDIAGNQSNIISTDGLTIDVSGPVGGSVTDGEVEDIDWSNNDFTVIGHWDQFVDEGIGVDYLEYSVGTNVGETDILDWINVNQDTSIYNQYVSIPDHNTTYYLNVRATDLLGNISDIYNSDGVTTDYIAPNISWVYLGGYLNSFSFCNSLDSLMLSTSHLYDDLSGLRDYQFAIGSTLGGTEIADWTTGEYLIDDSTAYIAFTGLNMIEGTTYGGSLKAVDNAGNISSISIPLGIIPDISSPIAGLVYDGENEDINVANSDSSLNANWSGFYDNLSGINYYVVGVGSQPILDDVVSYINTPVTVVEMQNLTLTHGDQYFVSVKAIDNVGNETNTISSDGFIVDKYAGPPLVLNISPDPVNAIYTNSDLVVLFELSEPINDEYSYNVGSHNNSNLIITPSYNSVDPGVTLNISGISVYADTITISLNEYVDFAELAGDTTAIDYFTPWLADYNTDWTIDVLDLAEFASDWSTDALVDDSLRSNELGPITGDIPYFTLTPDSVFDLQDLMGFTRMWNWSHQTQAPMLIASGNPFGEPPVIEQNGRNLNIKLPDEAEAGQIVVQYQSSTTEVNCSTEDGTANRILLGDNNIESSQLFVEYAYLSKTLTKSITLDAKSLTRDNSTVTVYYTLYSESQELLSTGSQDIELVAVPDKYALHQNYPNPFNPITTIEYDLPENAEVFITIYDILGREIKSLVNTDVKAGYHVVQWNGTNRAGNSVSAGMYLYRINAGDFNSVKKMVLLK